MEAIGRTPHSPPTNVLPKGEKLIRLPSEECETKFHDVVTDGCVVTNGVLLLDDHSAKRREVESRFESQGEMKPQILPPDEDKTIPLPSQECETKFHVSSTTDVPLLHG